MRIIIITITCLALICLATIFIFAGVLYKKQPPSLMQTDRTIIIDGMKLRYRVAGRGPKTLVLLHGFGSSLDSWQKIMPRLVEHGYKVYALDLIGFGGSDRPMILYDIESQRRHLVSFMANLNIDDAILVGSSMGGSIAAWTAARTPDAVSALIMIAPSAFPGSLTYPWPLSWIYKPGFWNWFAAVCIDNKLFRHLFPYSVAPQAISVTRSYNKNFTQSLRDIRQPTLLLWSTGDPKVPFHYSQEYVKRIPDVRLVSLMPSAGHGAIKTASEHVANEIIDFISNEFQNKP